MPRVSSKGKIQQVIWVDAAAMVPIMQLSRRYNLAPNVIISEILDIAANNEEVMKKVDEKLQPEIPKGILYPCHLCQKTFPTQNDLIKHLYTHAQPKQ